MVFGSPIRVDYMAYYSKPTTCTITLLDALGNIVGSSAASGKVR